MDSELLQCSNHGLQHFGTVCHHLLSDQINLGFHEQYYPDQFSGEGWCDACNEKWQTHNHSHETRELWEELCEFTIVCSICYDGIKNKNKGEFDLDLEVISTEQIISLLKHQKDHLFRESELPAFVCNSYRDIISTLSTQLISIEARVLSFKDAKELNNRDNDASKWVFAGSIAQDHWAFTKDKQIVYYEKSEDGFVHNKFDISFNQWLQLAFLLHKLDKIQSKYLITSAIREQLLLSFVRIDPSLSKQLNVFV